MAVGVFGPYSTIEPMFAAFPAWVPKVEQSRIASYQAYEEIYWNHPGGFKLLVRGTESSNPIYIPSARVIVETMNRYLGQGLDFVIDPLLGGPADQEAARLAFTSLFARERFRSKFASAKRFSLIRGDMVFHVTADDTKLEGQRLSIHEVDPASFFPVYGDPAEPNRITKIHLAEQFVDLAGKTLVRRQTYERMEDGLIYTSLAVFDIDKWAEGDNKAVQEITPPTPLPAGITAFPVYHFKNFDEGGNPYGSSEIRGFEKLMAGINQSINDEDIALALEGLGLYSTDGGGPTDDDGNPTDWILGPGRVVENASNFKRVQGIGSVTPFQDHMKTLYAFLKEASGTPDAAIGNIDVQTAESGVALALKLGPILSKAQEKEQFLLDVLTQMFYDLKAWFAAYEGVTLPPETSILPVFGDPLPVNRKAEVDLCVALVVAEVVSTMTVREHLSKFGFEFAADEVARIQQEKAMMTEATTPADPYATRAASELASVDDAVVPDALPA